VATRNDFKLEDVVHVEFTSVEQLETPTCGICKKRKSEYL